MGNLLQTMLHEKIIRQTQTPEIVERVHQVITSPTIHLRVVIKVPLPAQADASKKFAIESVRCLAVLKPIHLKLKLG